MFAVLALLACLPIASTTNVSRFNFYKYRVVTGQSSNAHTFLPWIEWSRCFHCFNKRFNLFSACDKLSLTIKPIVIQNIQERLYRLIVLTILNSSVAILRLQKLYQKQMRFSNEFVLSAKCVYLIISFLVYVKHKKQYMGCIVHTILYNLVRKSYLFTIMLKI